MTAFVSQTVFLTSKYRRNSVAPQRAPRMTGTKPPPIAPFRIGHGYDLHRLEPDLPLILGGIKLEHTRGCAGHSDGDAIYHCVVDAVLGALSLPDIGQIFPDTDPHFKGCESHVFMTAAYERMRDSGYRVGNVDITVILERPKMAPHKIAIRQNIADLLRTELVNVNLKAKTHEKVDAVGENRAVEVHAVAVLVRDGELAPEVAMGEASLETPASVGAVVTSTLLGAVGDRVARIQSMTQAGASSADSSCAVQKLFDTVSSRKGADASSSWTAKLFSKGRRKIAQKVGEEAVEVVIDAIASDHEGVVKESADLLYHLCVLWADIGVKPDDIWEELASREGTSGIAEKASRPKP